MHFELLSRNGVPRYCWGIGLLTAANDQKYMLRALALAEEAGAVGEVPVGAVLVRNNKIIGEGRNAQVGSCDPSAHAEIQALRAAAKIEANYRLPNTTLYATLEPCTMCCGAIVHARIERLVFATREPKAGAVISTAQLLGNPVLNHHVSWEEGVHQAESARLLTQFFKLRRKQAREPQKPPSE